MKNSEKTTESVKILDHDFEFPSCIGRKTAEPLSTCKGCEVASLCEWLKIKFVSREPVIQFTEKFEKILGAIKI